MKATISRVGPVIVFVSNQNAGAKAKCLLCEFYGIIIFSDSDLYDMTNSIIEIPVVRVQLLLMMM